MIRMTGINSGLDTESMIKEMSKARQAKVDKIVAKKTKTTWKQEKWKDLNGKISKFYSSLDNLKFTSSYNARKTTVSESGVATISTSNKAPLGSYKLNIQQTASYANFTSGKINASKNTRLSELGIDEPGQFEVSTKSGTKVIEYNSNTTIEELQDKLADTDLQVNFDESNKRFYINSKESGSDYNFEFKNDTGSLLSALKFDEGKYNAGTNLKMTLNGVDYESNKNTIEVNGLTINAQKATNGDVTINTEQDTSGIYDMIKNFIKEYNNLVKEIDKLYNADAAKGYDVLTEDEKAAMSDKEIERWEDKIKGSIFRKDETLGGIYDVLKSIGSKTYESKDGSKLSLASLGIETLNYFSAPENERYVLHINGDSEGVNSSKENKLQNLINSDPEKITEFFSNLTKDLYNGLKEKSSSISNTRTFGSFYSDKQMKTELDDYTKKIAEEEKKLNAYMDKFYKQFSRMEVAMGKLDSVQNSIAGLFNF